MAFLLLINERPDTRKQPLAVGQDRYDRMMRFSAALTKRGVLRASESLRLPADDGARLEIRAGKRIVVDGPFAEAKEIVGGFFLLDLRHERRRARDRGGVSGGRMGHGRGPQDRSLRGLASHPCRPDRASGWRRAGGGSFLRFHERAGPRQGSASVLVVSLLSRCRAWRREAAVLP